VEPKLERRSLLFHVESFLKDLKQSLRMFRRSPGFTIAALAALTLGVGTNTAIFSVVNAVLLKPIPFPDPDRLVMLVNTSPEGSFAGGSPAKFIHWRRQSEVIQDVAAFNTGVVNYSGGDVVEQLRSGRVTADYFRTFGAPVVRGRAFSAEEDRPKGGKVAMISHGLWIRRFGSDPTVVGRTISISGEPHTIIGIVGPTFNVAEFGSQPDIWLPFQFDPETTDHGHYFRVAARLKPGIPLEQAQARLKLSAKEFDTRFPKALGPNESFSVKPFQEAFVQDRA
jgi:putative ABC transport system permease protein